MKKYLKQFASSIYFDVLGVVLVIAIAVASGYLNTKLNKFVYGEWASYVPLGLISVINVGFSMMSTRFTGKMNKLGNYLGIVNTILSGAIDYVLGNRAAIITYPVTFLIYTFAIKKWKQSTEGKPNNMSKVKKQLIGVGLTIGALIFSYLTNYIGFSGNMNILAYSTTLAFALSLVANAFNALKLTTQWSFWLVYNIVQLNKAFMQGNFANVGKYIFYLVNSAGALFIWKEKEA